MKLAVEPNSDRETDKYPFKVVEINGLSDIVLDTSKASPALRGLIGSFKPDVIQAHGYFALRALAQADQPQVPIIASIHSTPVWGERIVGNIGSFEEELQFAREVLDESKPKLMTAANKVYADAAKKISQTRVPVKVMPYPVDLNYFYKKDGKKIRDEFGLSSSDILIMTPSRIIERKGIKEIVGALGLLPDKFYLCLPAAFDPLDKDFWKSITETKNYQQIKDRIKIPNHIMLYDDMPYLYSASDIIAMPSYYEGAPVATVEAMTSGKPFVGADSQGINSFIRDGINGLLVPKGSVTELAEAIISVSTNHELVAQMTAQARQDIAYLSWDVQLSQLLKVYEAIIDKTSSTSKNMETVNTESVV
jgi:glycosyltransferase involved in cell wall biosynthesis